MSAKVGPFLDPTTGTPDFAAEQLRQQYDSVFSAPRPAWSITDPKGHFKVTDGDGSFNDFLFNAAVIEKACAELKGKAAAGPDSLPATLFKIVARQSANTARLVYTSGENGNLFE